MKKEYKKPEIEIIEFEVEDILTTSGTGNMGPNSKPGELTTDWDDLFND